VIDQIKAEVDKVCGCSVVSCADILAVAARDSVVALGGPSWKVRLGRRDSTTASRTQADDDLPSPFMDLQALIANFQRQGLNERDLVALSGGHSIGFSQCLFFRNRTYNGTNIDPAFAQQLRANCPPNGGDSNLSPLDPTPARFDGAYYNNLLGGPSWKVRLGRRDSTTASRTQAEDDIPNPFMDLQALIANFQRQGLNERDLVALSGGHTIGFSKCLLFKNRTYNGTNIDPAFAQQLRANCPPNDGDSNLSPLDPTPARFDGAYYNNLVKQRGLLQSDQALFSGGSTDAIVRSYMSNPEAFWADFARSMITMGNIKPLTGTQGQIRDNCRRVN
ncbi:hypothetical protein SLEP1_g59554, partial [Rubroshorea leprosula]